jgi:hypothetical protein
VLIRTLHVPGRNGTYSDDLVTVGLADLLAVMTNDRVVISRHGDGFVIKMTRPLDTETMNVDADPYDYIRFDDRDSDPPIKYFSYQQEREREKVYQAYLKSLQRPKRTTKGRGIAVAAAASQPESAPTKPRADLGLFKALNSMRKGSSSYQDVWRAWMGLSSLDRRRVLTARLTKLADDLGDDVDVSEPETATALAGAVRALQFYDPLVGKGPGRPKPDGASPASYDAKRVDWFEEFLKYRGMHVAMLAYSTGKNGADTRVMVLSPRDVPVGIVSVIRRDLLEAPIFGNVHSEIKAVIATTRSLINHSDVRNPGSGAPVVAFARRTPSQIIAGLNTAYFLSLGSAAAVMNASFIGLPGWFPIETGDDAQAWLDLLREFERALYPALREDRSEHVPILQAMLTCLSSGSLPAALEFFGRYATVQLQKDPIPPRFSVPLLRRIFAPMATSNGPLKPIVESEGFQAVARTIRQATVTEMYLKSKDLDEYEIKYGLAQEWRRKARVRDDFVVELTTFLADFEYETARKQEQMKGKEYRRRARPTQENIQEVIGLIDTHGSELICGLLLAFGFARDPHAKDDADHAEDAQETATAGGQ